MKLAIFTSDLQAHSMVDTDLDLKPNQQVQLTLHGMPPDSINAHDDPHPHLSISYAVLRIEPLISSSDAHGLIAIPVNTAQNEFLVDIGNRMNLQPEKYKLYLSM